MSDHQPKNRTEPPAFPTGPLESAIRPKRPLNICIASPEFIGLTATCNTGVAYTALAQALAAAGHHVTCLYLGPNDCSKESWEQWVDKYKKDGLTLVAVPQINASELVAPPHLIRSYETYHWLKKNDRFDIIHFPDRKGPGYHTLTAKHHGLAFARTTICVDLHSMSAWLKAVDQDYADLTELDTSFMERRTVALADAVVSPSHYLLKWISQHQWEMPRNCHVQQGILPPSPQPAETKNSCSWHEINELVFFGTLDNRAGLPLFCDALDAIPASLAKKITSVTFLGRESIVDGVPARNYLAQRANRWAFSHQFVTGLDANATMDYLRQDYRLAVIPSVSENSPYRVLECLVANVAFVASRVGGIPELIDSSDAGKVCFEPNPGALRAVLCSALNDGIHPPRAAVDARANERAWIALYENSLARPQVAPAMNPTPNGRENVPTSRASVNRQ